MANIKLFSLGGIGENGKNMYVVEVDKHIFILDAGIKYPDVDMYGIDAVIPKIDYLINRKDDIEGIFVSHGHEDNIGAIPYLLNNLKTRVYGTHFTISILEANLKANNMKIKDYKLFRINENKVMKFGDVTVKFFNTSHSIPESIGIVITTKDGSIVYCTDFNFSMNALESYHTSFEKITDIGKGKVLALMCESINASAINRINNDSLLEHNFNSILAKKPKRIFVGAFSTDLVRIQKIIDLCMVIKRKVAIYSSSDERLIDVAMESNYLKIEPELFVDLDKLTKEETKELENITIIVTGCRFEPYMTLVRMARDIDPMFLIDKDDKVVLICPQLPGTERQTTQAINTLCEYNVDLTSFDKTVIRSAHASPDDLKLLYNLLKPEYIIPIKGEYRHMYDHLLIAQEAGYSRDHIILLDNGEVLTFKDGKLEKEHEHIQVGDLLVDGSSIGIVDDSILKERSTLAEEGVVLVHATVNLRFRKIEGKIELTTRGFTHSVTEEELTNSLGGLPEKIINNALKKKVWDLDDVCDTIEKELNNSIYRYYRHRPIIIPIIKVIK